MTDEPRRLAVRVTADAARQVRGGHPWVYATSITHHPDPPGEPGDLAVVFDPDRAFAGIGLWDPSSAIRVRVLHHGRPRTIDDAFIETAIAEAIARREPLAASDHTTGYRLVHGENDRLGGLVVDRYDTTLVIKLYTPAWFRSLGLVTEILRSRLDPERIVLRLARNVLPSESFADGSILVGTAPSEPVVFVEHGLRFGADVVRGHKTGHFLDQRDNRRLIAGVAAGRRVLDVCCANGGFTLHAAAGGARSVDAVDISRGALGELTATLKRNRDRPEVRHCDVTTHEGDAFDVLDEMVKRRVRFDVIVLDPPSMAHTAAQLPGARRAYERFARLAVELVEPDGHVLSCSCSSRLPGHELETILTTAARRHRRRAEVLRRTAHALDHPVGFPQGEYLAGVFARIATVGS
jgi:23S rRNA (cytosine1962-C5)-methyltransferase